MSQTRDSMGGLANYYNTSLEPMQMLQAYRSGQPVINHIFRPQQQFLPKGLPSYTPPPAVPVSPYLPWAQQGMQQQAAQQNAFMSGGPGGDGSPGGVGTDGGADGSGGGGGGGGK